MKKNSLLFGTNGNILELFRKGEDPEQFDVTGSRLELLVVGSHRSVRNVESTGDSTEFVRLENSRATIVSDET